MQWAVKKSAMSLTKPMSSMVVAFCQALGIGLPIKVHAEPQSHSMGYSTARLKKLMPRVKEDMGERRESRRDTGQGSS